MTRLVALLRAVNVGGTGKLPMEALRARAEQIGATHVSTFIASGNLLCDTRKTPAAFARALEAALREQHGLDTVVITRTPEELARVAAGHAFADHRLARSGPSRPRAAPAPVRRLRGEHSWPCDRERGAGLHDAADHLRVPALPPCARPARRSRMTRAVDVTRPRPAWQDAASRAGPVRARSDRARST